MRLRNQLLGTLTALGVALGARTAHAQTAQDIAARRELLDQAQQARDSGDHARALDAATRAGTIQMTPSVRMFIAQEQQQLGQVADASGSADLCVREAERDATARNRDTIMQTCRDIANALRTRVGRVVVRVPSPAPGGLRVDVGGHTLNPALYGVPYMVNPGNVSVIAAAPGVGGFQQSVSVGAGASRDVTVTLTPGLNVTFESGGNGGGGGGGGANVGIAPWLLVGGGALVVGAGIVFFALRNNSQSQLEQSCDRVGDRFQCDDTLATHGLLNDASTFNTLTNVFVITGSVVIAGGLTWFLVGTLGGRRAEQAPRVGFIPTHNGGMLTAGGAF